MLSEMSQAEKDKYQMISLLVEYNSEAKLKEQNSNRLTDSKKGLALTKREVGWRGREKGIEGYCDWLLVWRT